MTAAHYATIIPCCNNLILKLQWVTIIFQIALKASSSNAINFIMIMAVFFKENFNSTISFNYCTHIIALFMKAFTFISNI